MSEPERSEASDVSAARRARGSTLGGFLLTETLIATCEVEIARDTVRRVDA